MLLVYKEVLKVIKAKLQEYIADGSRICLTADGWTASNSNSYLSVTAY